MPDLLVLVEDHSEVDLIDEPEPPAPDGRDRSCAVALVQDGHLSYDLYSSDETQAPNAGHCKHRSFNNGGRGFAFGVVHIAPTNLERPDGNPLDFAVLAHVIEPALGDVQAVTLLALTDHNVASYHVDRPHRASEGHSRKKNEGVNKKR